MITSSVKEYDSSSSGCPQYYSDDNTICSWREKICYWAYSTIDYFELSRKTVAICMNLFDRYLAANTRATHFDSCKIPKEEEEITSRQFLLISLTILYISIKLTEPSMSRTKRIKMSTMLQLCQRPKFEKQDIFDMEIKILHSLSWLVNPPTAVDFIADFLKFLPCSVPFNLRQRLYMTSRYMAELSICDPFFMDYFPSTIAFAAVVNSIEDNEHNNPSNSDDVSIFYNYLKNNLGFCRNSYPLDLIRERLHDMVDAGDPSRSVKTFFMADEDSTGKSSNSYSMKVVEPEHTILTCK